MDETLGWGLCARARVCVYICKMSGSRCTRSAATLSYDNGEKLISANIVLLQFAFAIYFADRTERECSFHSILVLCSVLFCFALFGSVRFGSVYFVLVLISTHTISVYNGKFMNVFRNIHCTVNAQGLIHASIFGTFP